MRGILAILVVQAIALSVLLIQETAQAAPMGNIGPAVSETSEPNEDTWRHVQEFLLPEAEELSRFGRSADLWQERLVVGARGFFDPPTVTVFERFSESQWLVTDQLIGEDSFGEAIAVHQETLVVADPDNHGVHVYERSQQGTWEESAQLTAPDLPPGRRFGLDVDVWGDRIVVGAPNQAPSGADTGALLVFERGGEGLWSLAATLTTDPVQPQDFFGMTVALWDDRIAVGVPNDSYVAQLAGSIAVFDLSGGTWVETTRLHADGSSRLGLSLDLYEDRIVGGAPWTNDEGDVEGAAYIFEVRDGGWTTAASLVPPVQEFLGESVAIHGDLVVVGDDTADRDDGGYGRAYVFRRQAPEQWSLDSELVPQSSQTEPPLLYGASAALWDGRAVVGARGGPGSAHMFEAGRPLFVQVALGDSYQSGEGEGWDVLDTSQYLQVYENGSNYSEAVGSQENTYTPDVPIPPFPPGNSCHRGLANYAKLNRDLLEPGAQTVLVDRTCSGAEIEDGGDPPVVFDPADPPLTWASDSQIQQAIDRLTIAGIDPSEVDLVTVGMGGNDAGFGELVFACILPSVLDEVVERHPDPPGEAGFLRDLFGTCRTFAGGFGFDSTNDDIDALIDLEVRGWTQILAAFPNARVLHLEYPATLPESLPEDDWCGGILGEDVGYANTRVERINQRIRDAAEELDNPRLEIASSGLAFRGPNGENNPLCPKMGTDQRANGIPRDNFDSEIDRLLNLVPGGDAEARQRLDNLIAEYRELKNCLADSDCFFSQQLEEEAEDVDAAFTALKNHLVGELDRILENLARDPASGESREIRFDRSRQLFHPNADGFEVLACYVRESHAGRLVQDFADDCFVGGARPIARVEGADVGFSPFPVSSGQLIEITFGGFGPDTIVDLFLESEVVHLGTFAADNQGVVSQTLELPPASPGVHRLVLEGTTATGVGITKSVLIEYPGFPSVGDGYSTYVCCFETTGGDLDPPDEVTVSLAGFEFFTTSLDPLGGVVVEVPVPVSVGDPSLQLEVVHSDTGETISPEIDVNPSEEGVRATIQAVIADLESEIDSNPDAEDKLEDAIAGLETALDELDKNPTDREAASGNVEGAVGDLEAAVSDGVVTTGFGETEMDLLATATRALARLSIGDAIVRDGDPSTITEAETLLAAGDVQRADSQFKEAVATYKDAVSKAEGA